MCAKLFEDVDMLQQNRLPLHLKSDELDCPVDVADNDHQIQTRLNHG
jgi:hypothetical protein